jgi:MATE family multidrug resistance protein
LEGRGGGDREDRRSGKARAAELAFWPRVRSALRPGAQSAVQREVIALAWPMAAAMLGETAMGLVDTKLVGGLGASSLGGVGVATTLMYLAYAVVFGVMRGVKVRTAYAVGNGEAWHGERYAKAGVLVGLLLGVVVLVLGRDITWALHALGVDGELVDPARDFLRARTLGAPAACVVSALIQHRQGMGDTRSPMVVGIVANAVNAVLAYALIYGAFGAPRLGVAGAGYATAAVEYGEVLALSVLFVRESRRLRKAAKTPPLPMREALSGIASLGVPSGLQFGIEMLAFTAFTAVLGSLGEAEIAAHQIALATIRVSFLPGVACAEAASVLVGRALGGRKLRVADEVTKNALALAVGFMAICGVGFALFGSDVAALFTDDNDVRRIAGRLFLVAAIFQVLDAVSIVLRGALRGAKDVRAVAFIGIAVIWTCVPTAAFFLGKQAGYGAVGGWIGFVAETTLGAILLSYRWRRGAWRRDYGDATSIDLRRPAAVVGAA